MMLNSIMRSELGQRVSGSSVFNGVRITSMTVHQTNVDTGSSGEDLTERFNLHEVRHGFQALRICSRFYVSQALKVGWCNGRARGARRARRLTSSVCSCQRL